MRNDEIRTEADRLFDHRIGRKHGRYNSFYGLVRVTRLYRIHRIWKRRTRNIRQQGIDHLANSHPRPGNTTLSLNITRPGNTTPPGRSHRSRRRQSNSGQRRHSTQKISPFPGITGKRPVEGFYRHSSLFSLTKYKVYLNRSVKRKNHPLINTLAFLKILRTIRLLITFYRSFFILNILITLVCMVLFREYGFGIFTVLFWLKLATMTLVFYHIRSYRKKEFYYYQNLGLSRSFLWTTTLLFDFCLYLFGLWQVYKLFL